HRHDSEPHHAPETAGATDHPPIVGPAGLAAPPNGGKANKADDADAGYARQTTPMDVWNARACDVEGYRRVCARRAPAGCDVPQAHAGQETQPDDDNGSGAPESSESLHGPSSRVARLRPWRLFRGDDSWQGWLACLRWGW